MIEAGCHKTVIIKVDEDRIVSMIEAGFPRDPRPAVQTLEGDVDDQKKVRAENSETVYKTRLVIDVITKILLKSAKRS